MDMDGKYNAAFEPSIGDQVSTEKLGVKKPQEIAISSQQVTFSTEEIAQEKRNVIKNLAICCISILLVGSPVFAFVNSITSLLADEGLGITSLVLGGVGQLVGAALLVTYTTKVWGIRPVMIASFILPVFFILSFFYPTWYTTVPTGALVGITLSVMVSTTFMYGNALGFWYVQVTSHSDVDTVLVLMSGMINSCLGGSLLFGNVLLYFILDSGSQVVDTTNSTQDVFQICGANYCNDDLSNMTTMQPPETWRYNTMVGVFAVMCLAGAILSFFAQDFGERMGCTLRKKSAFFPLLKETWLLLKDPRGYLLIVITVFIGLEEAFIMSEYTQSFISCTIGIPKVGLVMCTYGVTQILISTTQWVLVKYIGRLLTILLGFSVLMACFITLLLWQPDPKATAVLFTIVGLWGGADSIVISTIFSVYALLFEDNIEGSFSVTVFWWSLGYMLSFGWSQSICVSTKIYLLIAFGTVGFILYGILELLIRRNKFKTTSNT